MANKVSVVKVSIPAFFLVLLISALSFGGSGKIQEKVRFIQDRFAISFWIDPPIGEDIDFRYAEIAQANFTVVLGGFGARSREDVRKQLDLSNRYGLRAIVTAANFEPNELPTGPALWGYMLKDEPGAGQFETLRAKVDAIRAVRPGCFSYINLFPNYASSAQLGVESYDEYVRRFVQEVGVDVLCMDYYPQLRPDVDGRDGYCNNLAVVRKYSLEAGIPFWNFFNTMPYGPHTDPTEAQIRWQIFSSLAYGAKGVLYFCYWTPRGDEFPKGGAIITPEGRRTRHYYQAMRINAALKNLGPILMELTSTAVYRVRRGEDSAAILKGSPIRSISDDGFEDYLVGVFRHSDGRRAVLLNNYHFAYSAWPTVVFDADLDRVVEISPETGEQIPVLDDSPDMEGLQLSLDAGSGRLFLLPCRE